jgi:hypothetical protein
MDPEDYAADECGHIPYKEMEALIIAALTAYGDQIRREDAAITRDVDANYATPQDTRSAESYSEGWDEALDIAQKAILSKLEGEPQA